MMAAMFRFCGNCASWRSIALIDLYPDGRKLASSLVAVSLGANERTAAAMTQVTITHQG